MHVVTRKSEVKEYLKECITTYQTDGITACVEELNAQILAKKVKFPLLEFCAHELFSELNENEHIELCNSIELLKTEGGNVILGIVLQNRLTTHFEQSIEKATEYISKADVWYVCDIIGERVYGFSLLNNPKATIPEIERLSKHTANWVVRALGAGVHHAVKKGLDKDDVKTVFPILLSMADTKDKEIRQGVGWAAKTIAKFHPEIIDHFTNEIHNHEKVANWFRAKISIGLNRHAHAKRS